MNSSAGERYQVHEHPALRQATANLIDSGIAICNAKTGERILHAPPHLSLKATSTTAYKFPKLENIFHDPMPWHDFTLTQQLLFCGEHMLGDKATSNTWGIDVSPLQDLVAVAFSNLPTAVPVYIMPVGEEGKVVIKPIEDDEGSECFKFSTPLDLDSLEGNTP
jgi:hypothetical protein